MGKYQQSLTFWCSKVRPVVHLRSSVGSAIDAQARLFSSGSGFRPASYQRDVLLATDSQVNELGLSNGLWRLRNSFFFPENSTLADVALVLTQCCVPQFPPSLTR